MSLQPDSGYLPPPDPMMDELRAIRDELGRVTSAMSSEERIRFFQEQAKQAAALLGCRLQPHPTLRNTSLMVRLPEGSAE